MGNGKDGRHFVKHYIAQGRELSTHLADREAAALWRLSLWIRYRDNTLRRSDGRPMTQKDIAQVLQKGERQAREILHALETAGAITSRWERGAKVYTLMDHIAYRGGQRGVLTNQQKQARYRVVRGSLRRVRRKSAAPNGGNPPKSKRQPGQ